MLDPATRTALRRHADDARPETAAPGHLIHVGWAKAASTSLQAWYASHPELAYVEGGIAGYRDVFDLIRQGVAAEPVRYRVTSAESLTAPTSFAGLPAHRGSDWGTTRADIEQVGRDLAGLFPQARILLITRGFRSIYASGYSQYVRTGGTQPYDPAARHVSREQLAEQWDYSHAVRLFRELFGGRLIVLPFELLRDDEPGFYRLLADELGLSTTGPLPPHENSSLSHAELRWYPRLTRAVEAMPLRGALRQRVLDAWVRRTLAGRFSRVALALERLRPGPSIRKDVAPELLGAFRGLADELRDDPRYAPYADEYLF